MAPFLHARPSMTVRGVGLAFALLATALLGCSSTDGEDAVDEASSEDALRTTSCKRTPSSPECQLHAVSVFTHDSKVYVTANEFENICYVLVRELANNTYYGLVEKDPACPFTRSVRYADRGGFATHATGFSVPIASLSPVRAGRYRDSLGGGIPSAKWYWVDGMPPQEPLPACIFGSALDKLSTTAGITVNESRVIDASTRLTPTESAHIWEGWSRDGADAERSKDLLALADDGTITKDAITHTATGRAYVSYWMTRAGKKTGFVVRKEAAYSSVYFVARMNDDQVAECTEF